jgi:hypothetical protein
MSNLALVNTRLRRASIQTAGALRRGWIYQRERFPLVTHVPLIAAFSFCTVSFSQMARGHSGVPAARTIFVAFASALLCFLQLRIIDEFKDAEDDARFRPYRPVPRGLVTLRELGAVGIAAAVAQLALALWLSAALLPFLLLVWGYLALTGTEFCARDWLRARPITYMGSHMLILPLIDLYGTACDWRVAGAGAPFGLIWLLFVSFCNGIVVEVGRKIRAPQDEEPGVETYSALWGRQRAVRVWLGALGVTAAGAWVAAAQIQFAAQASALLALLLLVAVVASLRFLRAPVSGRARWIELVSGCWTLLMYLSLGALPLLWTL